MIRIIQVKCPACGAPVFSKSIDIVILCNSCGAMHTREAGHSQVVECEAREATGDGKGEKVYLPIWVVDATYHIDNIKNKGDLMNLYGLLRTDPENAGAVRFYVPAYPLDPGLFKEMAMDLMANPPAGLPVKIDRKIRRVPCIMKPGLAGKLARFLFVTGVAESPGTLQELDYRLIVKKITLLYLPDYYLDEYSEPDDNY